MTVSIIACVVLSAGFAQLAWIFTNPQKPCWAFWTTLLLACAFIGLTIGVVGTWIIKTFLI